MGMGKVKYIKIPCKCEKFDETWHIVCKDATKVVCLSCGSHKWKSRAIKTKLREKEK